MVYKIELTVEELRIVADALSSAPFKLVAAVIAKIQQQAVDQEKKQAGQGNNQAAVNVN